MVNTLRIFGISKKKAKDLTKWRCYSDDLAINVITSEFWNLTPSGQRRVNMTLKNAVGNLVVNTSVKYAIFEYRSGEPNNYNWMVCVRSGYVTSSASGVIDILYNGIESVGSSAYVAIINGSETMIYPIAITYN